jgi:uncharacterized protein
MLDVEVPVMSMFESVEFESQEAVLRGRLYRPPGGQPLRVVVMAHGFSATITMTAHRYAEVFQQAGLAVLLYDHRNFGASDGEPRHEINPWLQARGYRDTVTFVATLPGVDPDRIALWGDSFSGAVALVAAGVDQRVAAVVAQVPATGREQARRILMAACTRHCATRLPMATSAAVQTRRWAIASGVS